MDANNKKSEGIKDKVYNIILSEGLTVFICLFIITILIISLWNDGYLGKNTIKYTKDGGNVIHESWNEKDKGNNSNEVIKNKFKDDDIINNSNKVITLNQYKKYHQEFMSCSLKIQKGKTTVIKDRRYKGNYYTDKDMAMRISGVMNMYDSCYNKFKLDLSNYKLKDANIIKSYQSVKQFNREVNKVEDILVSGYNNSNGYQMQRGYKQLSYAFDFFYQSKRDLNK